MKKARFAAARPVWRTSDDKVDDKAKNSKVDVYVGCGYNTTMQKYASGRQMEMKKKLTDTAVASAPA
jgi:hypothetical protein